MHKNLQLIAGVAISALSVAVLTQSAIAATNVDDLDERITTRQVATLLNRDHYLDVRLADMQDKIMAQYIDTLDANRTLFLQSDIDEFNQTVLPKLAISLKRGDLAPMKKIFARYQMRQREYMDFAHAFLAKPVDLHQSGEIVVNREEAPRFADKTAQERYWGQYLTSQIVAITMAKDDDKAKDAIFAKSARNDLVKADTRDAKTILQNRLARQDGQLQRLKNDDIMETMLNSAMQAYDPHSNYYAPVQANDIQIQSNLELEGIGVSILPDRKNPDYTRIASLVDGGPAAKTGQVREGDVILGVAQAGEAMVDTVGFSTREIVAIIRGKRGTAVTLRLKQSGAPDSSARTVTIVRDVVSQEEAGVRHRVIKVDGKRVGVIEIPSFYLNFKAKLKGAGHYRSVSDDTLAALKALKAQKVDGIVVDLRGNPGGSLDEVAKMIGLFVDGGATVQIQDNLGRVQVYPDDQDGVLYNGKMVVIVNLASASASEIFAAAMQDYGRALIVGSTTTGKGTAQVQLDNIALGQATLTQRKFYRITGDSTQNKGVVPDIDFVNIYQNAEFGERSYKNAMAWDTIKPAQFTPENRYSKPLIGSLAEQSKARQLREPNFVFLQTLNQIRAEDDDKKPTPLDIDKRRAKAKALDAQVLHAENIRRKALGLPIHKDWANYQAYLDELGETRAKMNEAKRPKLPEDEAFVIEAARIMLSALK